MMFRLILVLLLLSYSAATRADDSEAQTIVLEQVDRTLSMQPAYESTPKYALIVLGASGKTRVWMVEDGKRLYLDKNANGDLTDDGPPIVPSDARQISNGGWDFNYLLQSITPAKESCHSDFNLRRWNYRDEEDSYGLSINVDGQLPMYAGWFGTFWSIEPDTAPVIHFGGPLTPKMLREKEFTLGSGQRRLSMALINPGSGPGATSRLSIDALPSHVIPRLDIQWPSPEGSTPLRTSHDLMDRCCYWEFYTTDFKVPEGITTGTAIISVYFPDFDLPFKLTTMEMEVPVVESSDKTTE